MTIDRVPLRYARGTATDIAAYVGPLGEPVINTDTGDIHVQDAVTPGGIRQISDKSPLVLDDRSKFAAPLISIIGRSMDLRKFGACTISAGATAAQRDANTKTIGSAVEAAFYDRKINIIDYPAGDLYLGQGAASGTIRYHGALCYMQHCDNLILRGNNTNIWLPGTNEENYTGFFALVRNTGTCGFAGQWNVDREYPSVNQGRIVGFMPNSHIDVELDWAPSWSTVRYVTRWSEDGKPLAHLAARGARGKSGLPMTRISGGTGLRYRIDISGNDGGGVIEILNPSLTSIGQRVSLQHCTYRQNVFHAIGNERILIDDGFVIAGGAGMAYYAQHSPTIWRGAVRRPLRNGVRSLLSTAVDGIHIKGCGPSDIRGTIEGTGDDAVNIACWTDGIVSGSGSTLVIKLSNPSDGAPEVGQFVELIDGSRTSRGAYRVTARDDVGNQAALTVDGTLPSDITNAWVAVNRTTAEGYVVDVVARHSLGAGVRSSTADADITVGHHRCRREFAS